MEITSYAQFDKEAKSIEKVFEDFCNRCGGEYKDALGGLLDYFKEKVDALELKETIALKKRWGAFASDYQVHFYNNGGKGLFDWLIEQVVDSDYEFISEYSTPVELFTYYSRILTAIGPNKTYNWCSNNLEYLRDGIFKLDGTNL